MSADNLNAHNRKLNADICLKKSFSQKLFWWLTKQVRTAFFKSSFCLFNICLGVLNISLYNSLYHYFRYHDIKRKSYFTITINISCRLFPPPQRLGIHGVWTEIQTGTTTHNQFWIPDGGELVQTWHEIWYQEGKCRTIKAIRILVTLCVPCYRNSVAESNRLRPYM